MEAPHAPDDDEARYLSSFCQGEFASLAPFLNASVDFLSIVTEERLVRAVRDQRVEQGVKEELEKLVPRFLRAHSVVVDGRRRTLASCLDPGEALQEVFLPAVAPSSVNEEEMLSGFVLSNVVERREFVELLACLSQTTPDPEWIDRADALIALLDRLRARSEEGLWVKASHHELFAVDHGCARVELAYSSVIGSFLAKNVPELWSFHQMPARRGIADIVLCSDFQECGKFDPVCIMECGMRENNHSDMRKSLRGHAVNFSPIVPSGKYFLGVEIRDVDSLQPYIRVKAFFRVLGDDAVREVMLWNGHESSFRCMLAQTMKAVALAARQGAPRGSHWRVVTQNVAVDLRENVIYKAYNYRDRWAHVAATSRSDPEMSMRWIPGCTIVVAQEDFTLIRYAAIRGETTARRASDFVPLFEQLAKLHAEGLVHGDVRAYNMLFPAAGGVLIDFDFCGSEAVKTYPQGFQIDLPDSKRHESARPGSVLRKEHDCFSLGAVLTMYDCEADREGWKELIGSLQNDRPELGSCLTLLRRVGSADVRWKGAPVSDCFFDR
jgi:hypothetical protein